MTSVRPWIVYPPLLLRGLRGERAVLSELLRRVGTGEVPISALGDSGPKFDPDGPRARIAPWGKMGLDNQQAIALAWLNDAVAIAGQPVSDRVVLWARWQRNVDKVKQSWLGMYTATLPLLLMPAVTQAGRAHSQSLASLGATAILLAAERHRRKTNAWPGYIDATEMGIPLSLTIDPFSGKPFRMRHRDGQFTIYSVGPNGKDEDG